MRSTLLIAASCLIISSCASTRLYNWGSYEQDLFNYYERPETQEVLIAELEENLQKQAQQGNKPAPGLYAELATLYLEKNDTGTAISYYRKEYDAWPESRPLMQKLIKNLEADQ